MTVHKHIDFQVPDWVELQDTPRNRLSYRGEVMADSPLIYLRLGESSGPIANDEAGQHNAIEVGTLSWEVSGPLVLDSNTAIGSSGTGSLVISDTGWLPIGSVERTIEIWCKPNNNTIALLGVNYGTSVAGSSLNFIYTADEVSVDVSNCRFGVQGLSLADQWHHYVLVFPNGATRCDEFIVYLDGLPLAATVIAGQGGTQINTSDSILLINQATSGERNHGDFDEVAIYGSALSAQRIFDHYQAGINTGAT